MKTQSVSISKIKPNPNNPRLIKDDKFAKLVTSIQEFPEMLNIRPIVVNKDMVILGGNMRFKACKEAGLKEIPIIIADLTEEQEREFIIKDNISGGEWDWNLLANEWDADQLTGWGLDVIGFDIDGDGFGTDFSLKDGDKAPFQQMTFTLADAQAERIKEALDNVDVKDGTEYGNENSNGNKLHQIILEWDEQRK